MDGVSRCCWGDTLCHFLGLLENEGLGVELGGDTRRETAPDENSDENQGRNHLPIRAISVDSSWHP